MLSGSEEGTLHAWDLVEGKQLLKKQVHSGPVVALSCHPKATPCLQPRTMGPPSYGSRRAPQCDSGSGRSCMIEEERTGGTKNAADDARRLPARSLITS